MVGEPKVEKDGTVASPRFYQTPVRYNQRKNQRIYEICPVIDDAVRKRVRDAFGPRHAQLSVLFSIGCGWGASPARYPIAPMESITRGLDHELITWAER
jgi:hypothetical protein